MFLRVKFIILLLQLVSLSAIGEAVQYEDNRSYFDKESADELVFIKRNGEAYPVKGHEFRYKVLNKKLEEIYSLALAALSPYYKNLPPKPIVYVGDASYLITGDDFVSNIIVINNDIILNDKILSQKLLHEISHYFLNHTGSSGDLEESFINSFKKTQNPDGCVSCDVHWDGVESFSEDVKGILALSNMIGGLFEEEVSDVPFDIRFGGGKLAMILRDLVIEGSVKEQIEGGVCDKAITDFDFIVGELLLENCSPIGIQKCDFSKELRLLISDKVGVFEKNAIQCFNHLDDEFYSKVNKNLNTNVDSLRKLYEDKTGRNKVSPDHREIFEILFEDINPFFKLKKLYRHYGNKYNKALADLNIDVSELRYISEEDTADIMADLISPGSVQLGLFHSLSLADRDKCLIMMREDGEPNQGFLDDDHHSICWRFWRSKQVYREIKENSKNKEYLIKKLLKNSLIGSKVSLNNH